MTDTQDRATAFKIGFLKKLAEDGLLPDAFFNTLVKEADGILDNLGNAVTAPLGTLGSNAVQAGVDAGKGVAGNVLGAAVGLPVALGATAGAVNAKLNSPTDEDLDVVRKLDLLRQYRRAVSEIEARRAMKTGQ